MAKVIYNYIETHIFLNRKQQVTRMTIALAPPIIENIIVTTSNAMEAERGNRFHLEQRGTQSPLSSQKNLSRQFFVQFGLKVVSSGGLKVVSSGGLKVFSGEFPIRIKNCCDNMHMCLCMCTFVLRLL